MSSRLLRPPSPGQPARLTHPPTHPPSPTHHHPPTQQASPGSAAQLPSSWHSTHYSPTTAPPLSASGMRLRVVPALTPARFVHSLTHAPPQTHRGVSVCGRVARALSTAWDGSREQIPESSEQSDRRPAAAHGTLTRPWRGRGEIGDPFSGLRAHSWLARATS